MGKQSNIYLKSKTQKVWHNHTGVCISYWKDVSVFIGLITVVHFWYQIPTDIHPQGSLRVILVYWLCVRPWESNILISYWLVGWSSFYSSCYLHNESSSVFAIYESDCEIDCDVYHVSVWSLCEKCDFINHTAVWRWELKLVS